MHGILRYYKAFTVFCKVHTDIHNGWLIRYIYYGFYTLPKLAQFSSPLA